jgi:hypothetical protein
LTGRGRVGVIAGGVAGVSAGVYNGENLDVNVDPMEKPKADSQPVNNVNWDWPGRCGRGNRKGGGRGQCGAVEYRRVTLDT